MKKNVLFLLFLSITNFIFSQNCTVKVKELQGSYEGDCVKGLAEGDGKAIGIDTYIGNFVKGVPDGFGKYMYKNNNFYIGSFKKGKKHGLGEVHYLDGTKKDADTLLKGYWKEDNYIGLYPYQYKTINKSGLVREVNYTNEGNANNPKITIELTKENSGQQSFSSIISNPVLRNITLKGGSYTNIEKVTTQTTKNIYYLLNVEFPFKAVLEIDDEQVEVEINQKADWKIFIKLRFTDL